MDSLCGLTKSIVTTSAFTEYADMVNVLFKHHKSFEWSETSILNLQIRVQTFKKHVRAAFVIYQASKMLAQIWHALDQLREIVTHVSGIESIHAGTYEALHKQSKTFYALSSKKRSAINEVVAMQINNSPEAFHASPGHYCAVGEVTNSSREARRMDSTVLARSGGTSSLLVFESVMFKSESREDWRAGKMSTIRLRGSYTRC